KWGDFRERMLAGQPPSTNLVKFTPQPGTLDKVQAARWETVQTITNLILETCPDPQAARLELEAANYLRQRVASPEFFCKAACAKGLAPLDEERRNRLRGFHRMLGFPIPAGIEEVPR